MHQQLSSTLGIGVLLLLAAPPSDPDDDFLRKNYGPEAWKSMPARTAPGNPAAAASLRSIAREQGGRVPQDWNRASGDPECPGGTDLATTHNDISDLHRVDSASHNGASDFHCPSSDTHKQDSTVHYEDSDTHYYQSDMHFQNSDWHAVSSDYHFNNTDIHWKNSDIHTQGTIQHSVITDTHRDPTDTHRVNSDIHFDNSDLHKRDSSGHYDSSTNHTGLSTSHSGNSDYHQIGSSQHYSNSGEGNNGQNCPQGSPNWGDADVSTAALDVSLSCVATFDVDHRIVTVNTDRARDLYGQLRLKVVGGDPSCVELRVGAPNGPIYVPGTNYQVIEPGHWGCGVHTWHQGRETFYVTGLKRGSVSLQAEVDPDPELEGDGSPQKRTTITLKVGQSTQVVTSSLLAIIPSEAVINLNPSTAPLFGCFGGDVPVGGGVGTYRLFQSATIPLDTLYLPQANSRLAQMHNWLETKGYHPNGCLPSQPWWAMNIDPVVGIVTASATLPALPSNTAITIDETSPGILRAHHMASGANPLEPLAPAIDANLFVHLKECDGDIFYHVSGTHDAFPGFSLLLSGQEVYSFDPRDDGYSPLNLAPPEEILVITPWKKL